MSVDDDSATEDRFYGWTLDRATAPGVGKPGEAPCGHAGEHVIGTYVRCLRGCAGVGDISDGVPLELDIERTRPICPRSMQTPPLCSGTGEVVVWTDRSFWKNGIPYWLCRGCGKSFHA